MITHNCISPETLTGEASRQHKFVKLVGNILPFIVVVYLACIGLLREMKPIKGFMATFKSPFSKIILWIFFFFCMGR